MFMGLHRRYWFLISNACGAAILLLSAHDYFEMMRGDRLGGSFCNLNSYWNCDRASLSALGSWRFIPTGILGALWFFVISILGLGQSGWKNFLRLFLVGGLAAMVGFASYLVFVLRAGCLICFSAYVFLLLSVYLGWGLPAGEGVRSFSVRSLSMWGFIGIISLGGFTYWNRSRLDDRISEAEFAEWFKLTESVPLVSPLQKGAADGKVTVVEFSDFGCPFCAKSVEVLIPFLMAQPDVKLVFFPFPLDSACNSMIDRVIHPFSCDWSKVVLCAQETGEAWTLHDAIFAETNLRGGLSDPRKVLKELSPNADALLQCMDNPTTRQTLKQIVDVGQSMKIERTPTFFVNGRRFEGVLPMPLIRRLLAEFRKPGGSESR